MARNRFSEDVLTRTLDFCDERGMRLGQLIFNVVRERFASPSDAARFQAILFYVENGDLETWITEFIDRAQQRRRILDDMVQAEIKDGTYDLVPPEYGEPDGPTAS